MIDLSRDTEPTGSATERQVLVVDVGGPSAYPEDGLTLLEQWTSQDRLTTFAVSALTKTTATVRLPFLFD